MHNNYFEVSAENNFELGLQLGKLFRENLNETLKEAHLNPNWDQVVEQSSMYLKKTKDLFPHLIEELKGYAKGADVDFMNLWALSLEDELYFEEKCSTVITNNGMLVGHNEDYKDAEEKVCILKKTIKGKTILELYYLHTLGGNSISINSNGYIHAIDSLSQSDRKVGIPKNVIARWFSETSSPSDDFQKLSTLDRSSGFCHNIVNITGEVITIESTATKQLIETIETPFVHTNHYLTDLKTFEANDNSTCTFERFKSARENIKEQMKVTEMQSLLSLNNNGPQASLFNERTVGRMIIDNTERLAYIWLGREKEKGWIKYNLNFIV
ncbi:hypothetical protein HYV12_01195 [Candidatus Dojkabacteria bacterium]|nr:hypothetical protein [Candidatus Dojkabacteria bacterium]